MCPGGPPHRPTGVTLDVGKGSVRILQSGDGLSTSWSEPESITAYVGECSKPVPATRGVPGPKQVTSRCFYIWVSQTPRLEDVSILLHFLLAFADVIAMCVQIQRACQAALPHCCAFVHTESWARGPSRVLYLVRQTPSPPCKPRGGSGFGDTFPGAPCPCTSSRRLPPCYLWEVPASGLRLTGPSLR